MSYVHLLVKGSPLLTGGCTYVNVHQELDAIFPAIAVYHHYIP